MVHLGEDSKKNDVPQPEPRLLRASHLGSVREDLIKVVAGRR